MPLSVFKKKNSPGNAKNIKRL